MWEIIPSISIVVYLIALFILSLWRGVDAMDKRIYWFAFLKTTDIFGVVFLIELTSRWYFFLRTTEESVIVRALLAMMCALISLIFVGIACALCFLLYIALKRLYHFSFSKPIKKVKERTKRWLDGNWRLADDIVKKGIRKAFMDYWGF
jgi:hypothetical protein